MRIEPPYYPIVYVRGYAATMEEIEDTVATPYMGFNLGATKIRQNHKGEVVRFVFESPLIRLMKDEGYLDAYHDGDFIRESAPARSVWIFRYYDGVSGSFGSGSRRQIPEFARELRRFILTVRDRVCGADAEARARFKVYLVAHSMGGLICRCYLQNICRHGTGDAAEDRALGLPGDALVDKVFTYATPHNGIDLAGINVPNLAVTRHFEADTFNRDVMAQYLKLPEDAQRVDTLAGAFPPERLFCLVGTDYDDYTAFFGLSKQGAGPMSDGLVQIRNATVQGSPRAFVHRSHSGHYGIVNSEEGYQNLRRFLFGDLRVDLKLFADRITLPPPVEQQRAQGKRVNAAYYIDTTAAVRGARYFLHERRYEQGSAIMRGYDDLVNGKPVYLFSGYLSRNAKTAGARDKALAFQVRVAVQVPVYEIENAFWFDEHFHGDEIIDETVTFYVRLRPGGTSVTYGLASRHGVRNSPKWVGTPGATGSGGPLVFEIPLGFVPGTQRPPRPGFSGRLQVSVSPWND